ncbi:hypothetical protein M408DRAFT_330329 [Serendipita vermifera MAFF 305830]|uniref:Uncharacterized protein n=1 Tax=Serendipita vermifera MAFF 305830 TaxID=933852 RepID=A0A0C2XCX6_SERVB|nr:hypothetical protein M408DRAFT_330329 [Serendipita vermifera MAFF 305830]
MHINELPSEILQAIFELVPGKASRQPPPDSKPAVQDDICYVCRLWRDVAIEDPFLWNTIHFTANGLSVQRAERFLQRSGTAPLDIYMTASRSYERFANTMKAISLHGVRFVDLIVAQSHRWRILEVQYPSLVPNLKPLWNEGAPMLEKLVLSCPAPLQDLSPPRLMPGGPHFTSLTVTRCALQWTPWDCTTITKLTLGPFGSPVQGPTNKELGDMLSAVSERLSSLTIKGSWQSPPDDIQAGDPIILQALTSLNILAEWGPQVRYILTTCRFPNLVELDTYISFFTPLSPQLIQLLTEEPKLLQSVKQLTIGGNIGGIIPTGNPNAGTPLSVVLQRAFPQVEHVLLSPYMPLEVAIVNFLSRSWGSMIRLDVPSSDLPGIRELLSMRFLTYPTPLQELNLLVANGELYKDDYEWICSNVGKFTILEVRPDSKGFVLNREVCPFHEKLLITEAPSSTPRPPRRPMQIRAL